MIFSASAITHFKLTIELLKAGHALILSNGDAVAYQNDEVVLLSSNERLVRDGYCANQAPVRRSARIASLTNTQSLFEIISGSHVALYGKYKGQEILLHKLTKAGHGIHVTVVKSGKETWIKMKNAGWVDMAPRRSTRNAAALPPLPKHVIETLPKDDVLAMLQMADVVASEPPLAGNKANSKRKVPTDNVEEATATRPSKKSKSNNNATTDQECTIGDTIGDTIEDIIESVCDGDAAPVQNNQGVEEHGEEANIQHPSKMIKTSPSTHQEGTANESTGSVFDGVALAECNDFGSLADNDVFDGGAAPVQYNEGVEEHEQQPRGVQRPGRIHRYNENIFSEFQKPNISNFRIS